MKRNIEIDKETQKAIDKAVIKSLFRMLYLDDLVDREEYEKLLECTDKKFEDIIICIQRRKNKKIQENKNKKYLF